MLISHWRKRFLWLAVGQAISILTSSIFQMAIVWYLTSETESAMVITFATLCGYLPQAILGLFTGTFVDKHNRKWIVILADSSTALAALIFAVLSSITTLPLFAIFILLAVRSVGNAFQSPALNAMIPSIVPKEELPRCSGVMQSLESISLIASPAIAAILFGLTDIGMIAFLDVIGAGIAVFIVLCLKIPNTLEGIEQLSTSVFQSMKEAFSFIKGQKELMSVLVISSLYAFVYFPIGSMYPLMTISYFQGTFEDSSVVEIVFSVGSLLGSFVLGIIGNKVNQEKTIAASIGVYGMGVLICGLLPSSGLIIFMVLSVFMGFTLPFFYGMQNVIFQSRVPDEYLGRVLSLLYSVSLFATPVGLIAGGGFSEWLGIENAFLICGIFAVVLAVAMLLLVPSHSQKKLKD